MTTKNSMAACLQKKSGVWVGSVSIWSISDGDPPSCNSGIIGI